MEQPFSFMYVRHRYGSETVKVTKKYNAANLRHAKLVSRKMFLIKCRKLLLFPSHIAKGFKILLGLLEDNSCFNARILRMMHNFKKRILSLEIDITMWKLQVVEKELNHLRTRVMDRLQNYSRTFLKYQAIMFKKTVTQRMEVLNRKIRNLLISPVNGLNMTYNDRAFHNLTNVDFPQKVERILALGPNFALPKIPGKDQLFRLIADVDYIARQDFIDEDSNRIRARCANAIHNYVNYHQHVVDSDSRKILRMVDETKSFLDDNSEIIVTKADKGNVTVAMMSEEYELKMNELLDDENTYQVIKKNPTNCTQVNNNEIIEKLFEYDCISFGDYRRCMSHNALTPRIYGLPKIHKEGVPLRPVVSYIGAATYGTARFLSDLLYRMVDTEKYYINNSYDVREMIKNVKVPVGYGFISLDVSSLFTNIPTNLVTRIIEDKWRLLKDHTKITRDMFLRLLKLCINANYFSFRGRLFQMKSGMPMGSPLSPVLGDLVMERLLDRVLPRLKFDVPFVKKYVDDLILVVPLDKHREILEVFNDFHNKLQFTMETEMDKKIPFLDLWLMRDEDGNISTKWYHKPVASTRILNYQSNHHWALKTNTAYGLIHRVLTLSDKEYRVECIKTIFDVLMLNGYPKSCISKLIDKFDKNSNEVDAGVAAVARSKVVPDFYRSIVYIKGLTERISGIIRKEIDNMGIGYKSLNTLDNVVFTKTKDKLSDSLKRNLIYKIPCIDCEYCYVGQTGNFLKTRMSGHMSDIRLNKTEKSPLAEHMAEFHHTLDCNNVKILSFVENTRKRLTMEMCYIKYNKTFNRHFDLQYWNNTYSSLLWKIGVNERKMILKYKNNTV